MQIHHIDGNNSNNDPDNLAPLCGNCHERATLNRKITTNMANNYTPLRIKMFRDKWYDDVKKINKGLDITENTKNEVKKFVFDIPFPPGPRYGWAKMFPNQGKNRHEIIDNVFSENNTATLFQKIELMKNMYENLLVESEILDKFKLMCENIGIDYDDLT